MMKIKHIGILVLILAFFNSCSKKCKECYLVEAVGTPNEVTSSIGEYCGDELEDIDGKQYIAIDGPAKSYCE